MDTQTRVARVITGVFLFFFGGAFLGVGLLLSVALLDGRMFNDGKLDDHHQTTKGVVVDLRETNYSVNEQDVIEFTYEYTTPSQETVSSFSYSHQHGYQIGDTVEVQYLPENPYLSRIVGMTTTEMGLGALAFLLFPIIGFVTLVWGVVFMVKGIRGK